MKWKVRKQHEGRQQIEEEKKKNPSSTSSSSSSFSISNFLPLSWFYKLKPKRSTRTNPTLDQNPTPRSSSNWNVYHAQTPPRRLPEPNLRSATASAYLSFSAADVERFPPLIPDAPRRLSFGDDEGSLRHRMKHESEARRRHHHSVSELDFIALGHPFPSTRSRTLETDSGADGSADSDLTIGIWPRIRPRLRRERSKVQRPFEGSYRPCDPDRKVELPRRSSFSGKVRPRRAKAKVRICSPRPSAVRAEETGRTKAMLVAEATPRRRRRRAAVAVSVVEEEVRELERFAVVKSSRDPQRDFRESMVEMILEKGIGRPEELESLLACYLALNAAEHHDVIIKVFRQLWFELNSDRLRLDSKNC